MKIQFIEADTSSDLKGILRLQEQNLRYGMTKENMDRNGFVTVRHDLETLSRMNQIERHLIVKSGDEIVGYILAMSIKSRHEIQILEPMFREFDHLEWKGQNLCTFQYIVVGQVCIARDFRGSGLFDQAYLGFKDLFSSKYQFAITEISSLNQRSLKAHERVGFYTIHEYRDPDQELWHVVVWDWNQ